ncbi:peroxisomal leader peptide-processing protease [Coccinella septempunctata]|uniref:peroxisomal leader peptide-processing protease n=1 Tax=Coccinella septempunctata TaxID=41139 RepID=UPI001D087FCB|nr:peroxisomal leader peptide-processing protease [Coccinella septempunctata]
MSVYSNRILLVKKMDIRSVLVEARHCKSNSVYGTSGSMFNRRYIIATFHAVSNFFSNSEFERIDFDNPGSIRSIDVFRNILFSVNVNDELNGISTYTAHFKGCFLSEIIKESARTIFRSWSFDSSDNQQSDWMPIFIVLEIDCSIKGKLDENLKRWLDKMPKTKFSRGENLCCISSAFGNRDFMNHFSQGVVSNILGINNCLIFSDMPLTPGSEGSPVFTDISSLVPIGIVISTINWWKGEWLNFTVIADLRSLFSEILGLSSSDIVNQNVIKTRTNLMSIVESSLFQIYNGTIWGTAILISKEQGILITNAHVVESSFKQPIMIHQKERIIPCDVIFKSPVNSYIDIAVVKAKETLEDYCSPISFSEKGVTIGDSVFAAGFPIFSREVKSGATITKGHVCHVHPCMIKTTCTIHPGASGGAIMDGSGNLVAVIVCNAKTSEPINMTYPRLNMSIPAKILKPILEEYIESGALEVLDGFSEIDAKVWNFSSKL